MRAVIQRVSEAGVYIEETNYSAEIKNGMVVLLGVSFNDGEKEAEYLAEKCVNLRIFEDENEKMNLSLKDIKGEALIISQFSLYGDTKRGNRPSFSDAAPPDIAKQLYEKFTDKVKLLIGGEKVKTGMFAAMMRVKIINEGPVTIIADSK